VLYALITPKNKVLAWKLGIDMLLVHVDHTVSPRATLAHFLEKISKVKKGQTLGVVPLYPAQKS
jgi:hypothetical protein